MTLTPDSPQHYPPDYFAAQIRKSDAKIAWQYGRIFALAGLPDLLETARHLAPGSGVVLHDGSEGLPCASASADVLLLSELVEHLPDALPLLRECYRVLRPGGAVVITTPNLWDARRVLAPLVGRPWSGDTDPTHVNLYTPRRLARELRAAGFGRVRWHTGVKPARWLSSRRVQMRLPLPYPPLVGNGLLAVGQRT
jgi:SAM-dependent methyltransferase